MNTISEKRLAPQQEQDINFRLQEEFLLGSAKFENNPLHHVLKGNAPTNEKLKFIPDMLFFVMGFKDLMNLVRYETPQNELERDVNAHSDNDDYHWKWYLQDLAFLDEQFKNENSIDLICNVWDNVSFEGRNSVYVFARYMQEYQHPAARMLMVEVLEIGFGIFLSYLHPVLKESGLYDKLDYFGKKHQDVEESHDTGTSDDEISGLIEQLPENIKEDMLIIINQLFNQIYKMTENWAERTKV